MFFFSAKFWLLIQIGMDVFLVVLFIHMIRQIRRMGERNSQQPDSNMTDVVESVLNEAKAVAGEFEDQLKEKREIAGRVIQELDSRIINLNLLLKRTGLYAQAGHDVEDGNRGLQADNYDLQKEIIALSEKGVTPEKIADQLGVIKGEVNLVLDLKKKFEQMQAI
jgi:hypothetical protein